MRYRYIICLFFVTLLMTSCGSGDSPPSGGTGNSNPGWGGAGGSGTVGGSASTIKPLGQGNSLWPSGQTDGANGTIQQPDWGTTPKEEPTPQNFLEPLLNPKVDNVPPTPVPPPTQTSTPVPPPTPVPQPTATPVPPPVQQPAPQQPVYQPPAQQAQQPQADCICHSDYAAARGVQPLTRRCGEVLPGDQYVCVAPEVWQRR